MPGGERAAPHATHFRVLGVDGALNTVYRDLNAYVCFPPLVVQARNELGLVDDPN